MYSQRYDNFLLSHIHRFPGFFQMELALKSSSVCAVARVLNRWGFAYERDVHSRDKAGVDILVALGFLKLDRGGLDKHWHLQDRDVFALWFSHLGTPRMYSLRGGDIPLRKKLMRRLF